MLWNNFRLAAFLFFAWLVADSFSSIVLSNPLEGIYYPAASGRLRNVPGDWTNKPWFGAPLYLMVFSGIFWLFVSKAGRYKGLRLASIIISFAMAPFWIVSAISADLYGLDINNYWLASMIYANISFVIFGFIGTGRTDDMYL